MFFKSLSIVAGAALALCAGASQAGTVNGFANGGFETAYAGSPAAPQGPAADWLFGGTSSYTLDTSAADAFAGNNSALLACGSLCSTVLVQNSVKDGGLPALTVGDTPLLTFEVKGQLGTTGSDNFQLQYLDAVGNILYTSGVQGFAPGASYSQISFQGGVVPAGAVAAYLQISQGIGPTGPQNGGLIFTTGSLNVDAINLAVAAPIAAVPETESYAMMLAGLGIVGGVVRRRRRSQA